MAKDRGLDVPVPVRVDPPLAFKLRGYSRVCSSTSLLPANFCLTLLQSTFAFHSLPKPTNTHVFGLILLLSIARSY